MSGSLKLDGVRELMASIEALPREVSQNKIGPVIKASAESLAAELKSTYAKVTGALADGVVIEKSSDPSGLVAKVRSKAPHAHLYEYGTVRRFTNETGAYRGTMEPKATFVPAAVRQRNRMLFSVKSVLRSMRVPGFTGSLDVRES